jgi:hypothetical protein
MQHGVEAPGGENLGHAGGIGQVGLDQRGTGGHRGAMALGEVVEHDHLMPAIEERQHRMAADEAGTAGDEVTGHAGRLRKVEQIPIRWDHLVG